MLDDGIILMVKAIATSSAKIVAAGRMKFPKTSEIQQLLTRGVAGNSLGGISPSSGGVENSGPRYQDASAIATKEFGPLRVVLRSVMPLKLKAEDGRGLNGIRCSFEFINLDTQRALAIAAIAEGGRRPGLFSTGGGTTLGTAPGDSLRTTLVDDRGNEWKLYVASNITGLGYHRQKEGSQAYSPSEIPALLTRQDATGVSTFNDNWNNKISFVDRRPRSWAARVRSYEF